ncbi:MAG: histidine phosphotransferase family protein [Alphaproteobacteria bacterium]
MKSTIDAVQLMGSRLCHDLAAPIGAASLGLEMLHEKNLTKDQQDIVSLIEQSLSSTKQRLELFRFLLGYGQTEDKPLMSEILIFLDAYWQNSRLKLHTEGIDHLQGLPARFVLASILTASESLLRGGELNVKASDQTLSILLSGSDIKIAPETSKVLMGEATVTSNSLWAWYAHSLASDLQVHIEVHEAPLGIVCSGWGARIRT